jgi:hypothetical protein
MHVTLTAYSTVVLKTDSSSISRKRKKIVTFSLKKPAKQETIFTVPSLEKVPEFSAKRSFVIPVTAASRWSLSSASKFL